jgi:fucose permease
MTVEDWRRKIDEIDRRLVELLNERSRCVVEIGRIKHVVTVSIYLVALLGLANALMWPAIWPLAIADLGTFTKMGSSFLVTGIIGGAFLPLLFGYVADMSSHHVAYLVCLPAYIYIMYYALEGSKIRTKN